MLVRPASLEYMPNSEADGGTPAQESVAVHSNRLGFPTRIQVANLIQLASRCRRIRR